MDNSYKVYLHIKLTDGEPFYVGKGKKCRHLSKSGRNKYWNNIVAKYGFDVIILEEYLTNYEAIEKEVYWINRIGRRDLGKGTLVNMTDGGEGVAGLEPWNKGKTGHLSKETLEKMSIASKNMIRTNEHNMKIAKSNTGKKLSEKTKKKLSELNLGKKLSEETKKNISQNNKGKIVSLETRNKISNSNKGKSKSLEHIENLGVLILNTNTGIFYHSIKTASETINMKTTTLRAKLTGQNPNNTNFIIA